MDRVKLAMESLSEVDTYFVNDDEEKPKLYCNGGWNKAMEHFLAGDWDYLLLSSDDVILSKGWSQRIIHKGMTVYVPEYLPTAEGLENHMTPLLIELTSSINGACTLLPREAVQLIYPIPKELKMWFGDQYMFTKLRKAGYKVMQGAFMAFHYGQQSLDNPHAQAVIAEDKLAWPAIEATL